MLRFILQIWKRNGLIGRQINIIYEKKKKTYIERWRRRRLFERIILYLINSQVWNWTPFSFIVVVVVITSIHELLEGQLFLWPPPPLSTGMFISLTDTMRVLVLNLVIFKIEVWIVIIDNRFLSLRWNSTQLSKLANDLVQSDRACCLLLLL